ncbi:MAG: FixH family protein [Gammaproteobacteria bacterium]|nr:FixH family protein [Gammaproteobacteria bacterium]
MTTNTTTPTNPVKTPWYKVSWVWYIIFMKFAVITACIVTAILIYRNPISMVVDDYYNEGRSINLQLTRVAIAEERNISFYANFSATNNFELTFRSGEPNDASALIVTFFHPTTHNNDFELRMTRGADGVYRQMLPRELYGHWRVDIEPFDREWRVSQNIHLPVSNTLTILPVNYGI